MMLNDNKWKKVKIGDIAEKIAMGPFGSNIKVSTFVESGVPIISGMHLKGFYLNEESYNYITEEHAQRLKNSIVHSGDVIFTHAGNVGQVAMIPENCQYPYYMISQRQFYLRCDKSKVLPEFIMYYLHSYEGQGKLLSNVSQVGVPSIAQPSSFLKTIEIPLPSLAEQSKIVSILASINKKIELNAQINHNLEKQAKAIFKSWFIDAPECKAWDSVPLKELVVAMRNGDWGKDNPCGNNTEVSYCIRGADIPDVNAGNKGKMPKRYILPKNYEKKHLVEGDIVVEISGGSPTQSTGRCAVISQALLDRYEQKIVCTNFCKALKPLDGYSHFLYYYWTYLYEKGCFFAYENGTTGIKNLDISGILENEFLSIPPVEMIERFNELCDKIASTIFANGTETERLAQLRDALLPKLMSGEIDVSEVEV